MENRYSFATWEVLRIIQDLIDAVSDPEPDFAN
jgi:hypothetical protein